jgi:hypothetical protein
MIFSITAIDEPFPQLEYGQNPRHLECFIPAGVEWHQLNFGQGEGQVEIEGCEWDSIVGDPAKSVSFCTSGNARLMLRCSS